MLGTTLDGITGFGSAIIVLLFAQATILSAQFGLASPEVLPAALCSWDHWAVVITVAQSTLILPLAVASRPIQNASAPIVLPVAIPVLLGTLGGERVALDGRPGGWAKVVLGIFLGAYASWQIARLLYSCLGSRPSRAADVEEGETQFLMSSLPALPVELSVDIPNADISMTLTEENLIMKIVKDVGRPAAIDEHSMSDSLLMTEYARPPSIGNGTPSEEDILRVSVEQHDLCKETVKGMCARVWVDFEDMGGLKGAIEWF